MNILFAFIGFGFLVFIHELGHFIMARVNGIKVEEFAIGMGPTIMSKQGKETKWSLKLLPLGGLCQMKGEATGKEDEKDDDSFQSKTPLQKISVIFAGPFMNIVTALVIFTMIPMLAGGFLSNRVGDVKADSPAAKAGIVKGDEIIEINGNRVGIFQDVSYRISENKDKEAAIKVKRGEEVKEFKVTPLKDEETGSYMVGVLADRVLKPNLGQSFTFGTRLMGSLTRETFGALGKLVTGKLSKDQIGGPVAVIGAAANASKQGFLPLLTFIGIISISLAIFNLLPFPALDGGWIFILFIELITGKKMPEKYLAIWNGIGMILLLLLMILVTFKDVRNLLK